MCCRAFHRSLLAAFLVWAAACSAPGGDDAGPRSEQAQSAVQKVGARDSIDDESARWSELPFDRLRLSRRGCYGTCPVYELELRRGGQARWKGSDHTPRFGMWGSEVSIDDYARLCDAALEFDLERMDEGYRSNAMHGERVVIEWERAGVTGSVSDYARSAPEGFQELRALLEEIGQRLDWRSVLEWD